MKLETIDRDMLHQLLEKYDVLKMITLRLSELERVSESNTRINDAGSDFDLKQITSQLKLLDEVMESVNAVEVQIDQLESLVNSAENLMNHS